MNSHTANSREIYANLSRHSELVNLIFIVANINILLLFIPVNIISPLFQRLMSTLN